MEFINKVIVFITIAGHFFRRGYPLVRISYPDLIEDYLQRHISYYDIMTDEASRRFDADEQELQKICRKLSVSNIYQMLTPIESLRQPEYKAKIRNLAAEVYLPETRDTESPTNLSFYEVDLLGEKRVVDLFRCHTKIDQQIWFIAYGFAEDIYYLFVQPPSKLIRFEALIEHSSELDRSLSLSTNYLEKSFINTMNHRSGWKPWVTVGDDGPLCSLNRNQLFRLCSSVDEATNPTSLATSVNYDEHYSVHPSSRKCLLDQKIYVDEILKSPSKYPKTEIRVNLAPCSINARFFYLTHDPSEENAVFVVEGTHSHSSKSPGTATGTFPPSEVKFKVKSRVRKISVLKLATHMF